MRVCLDIQAAAGQFAGVGRYTRELAAHLAPLRGQDALTLFHLNFKRRKTFAVPGAHERVVTCCPGRVAQKLWREIGWPPFDWVAGSAEVFHFPNYLRYPVRKGRTVVTIHDLSYLRFPETLERKNLTNLRRHIPRTLERVDRVITVSAFSGRELAELTGFPSDRIVSIPLGMKTPRMMPDQTEVTTARHMYKIERPYLLCVSTLEPRKNYPFLIEVFESLSGFDGDLIIVGGRGWSCDPILQRMGRSPLARRIRYLEYVDERLLPGLYAGAEAFVFPSHYEGFGFTPLEAMAYGTPVISSNGGSLAEVLGSAAEIVDTFDTDRWCATVQSVLEDTSGRAARIAAGREHVAKFRWEETARRTWEVYRSLA